MATNCAPTDPAGPVLIGGIYRLHDQWSDTWYEVPVHVDLAAVIQRLDEAMAARERRHQARVRTFTDMEDPKRRREGEPFEAGIPQGQRLARLPPTGSEWEGPHFSFTLLIGISRVWAGPPADGPCLDCGGRQLPGYAYCVGCDRCGRELRIPLPSRADLARKRMLKPKDASDGLTGGVGQAKAARKPAPPTAKNRWRVEIDRMMGAQG